MLILLFPYQKPEVTKRPGVGKSQRLLLDHTVEFVSMNFQL